MPAFIQRSDNHPKDLMLNGQAYTAHALQFHHEIGEQSSETYYILAPAAIDPLILWDAFNANRLEPNPRGFIDFLRVAHGCIEISAMNLHKVWL